MENSLPLQLYYFCNCFLALCVIAPNLAISIVALCSERNKKNIDSISYGGRMKDGRSSKPSFLEMIILIISISGLLLMFYFVGGEPNIRMAMPFMIWPILLFTLAMYCVYRPWRLAREWKALFARMLKMKYVTGWLVLFLVAVVVLASLAALSNALNPGNEYVLDFYRPLFEPFAPLLDAILPFFGKDADGASSVVFISIVFSSISALLNRRVGGYFPDCDSTPVGNDFNHFSRWILSLVNKCIQISIVPLVIIYAIVKLSLQDNWALATFLGSAAVIVGVVELVVVLLMIDFIAWFGWSLFSLNDRAEDDAEISLSPQNDDDSKSVLPNELQESADSCESVDVCVPDDGGRKSVISPSASAPKTPDSD